MRVLGEYQPPPSPSTPGKEETVQTRRGSDGKLRGRKRVTDPAPPLDSDIEVHTHTRTHAHAHEHALTHTLTHTHQYTHAH